MPPIPKAAMKARKRLMKKINGQVGPGHKSKVGPHYLEEGQNYSGIRVIRHGVPIIHLPEASMVDIDFSNQLHVDLAERIIDDPSQVVRIDTWGGADPLPVHITLPEAAFDNFKIQADNAVVRERLRRKINENLGVAGRPEITSWPIEDTHVNFRRLMVVPHNMSLTGLTEKSGNAIRIDLDKPEHVKLVEDIIDNNKFEQFNTWASHGSDVHLALGGAAFKEFKKQIERTA